MGLSPETMRGTTQIDEAVNSLLWQLRKDGRVRTQSEMLLSRGSELPTRGQEGTSDHVR